MAAKFYAKFKEIMGKRSLAIINRCGKTLAEFCKESQVPIPTVNDTMTSLDAVCAVIVSITKVPHVAWMEKIKRYYDPMLRLLLKTEIIFDSEFTTLHNGTFFVMIWII